jgi:hypothetical protein
VSATPLAALRAPLSNDDALGRPNRCTAWSPPKDDPRVGFVNGVGGTGSWANADLATGRLLIDVCDIGSLVGAGVDTAGLDVAGLDIAGLDIAGLDIVELVAESMTGGFVVGDRKTTEFAPSE